MTYLRPSNNRGHSHKAFWIVTGATIILVSFGFILSHLAFVLGGPLWAARLFVVDNLDTGISYFSSKASLSKEIDMSKKELETKNAEILSLQNQLELYKGLDKYISLQEPKKGENIVRVVTRPLQTPFDELILYTASSSFQVGDKVYFADIPVGSVVSSAGSYARANLFSHPAYEFSVLVGSKKIEGNAKGKGGGNVIISLPKSSDVKLGDIAYLADGTIPFGTISQIDNGLSQSFVDVYVSLPFSPMSVEWLSVRAQ